MRSVLAEDLPSRPSRDEYQLGLFSVLQCALISDPEIRYNAIDQDLKFLQGPEADTLRVLLWLKEGDPKLQNELLRQVLSTKPMKKDVLARELNEMTAVYDREERAKRKTSIDRYVEQEVLSDQLLEGRRYVTGQPGGPLSHVPLELLFGEVDKRKMAYEALSAECSGSATKTRLLLWLAEPSAELRQLLLEQARSKAEEVRDISFRREMLTLASVFSQKQQAERVVKIERLWPERVGAAKEAPATIQKKLREDRTDNLKKRAPQTEWESGDLAEQSADFAGTGWPLLAGMCVCGAALILAGGWLFLRRRASKKR